MTAFRIILISYVSLPSVSRYPRPAFAPIISPMTAPVIACVRASLIPDNIISIEYGTSILQKVCHLLAFNTFIRLYTLSSMERIADTSLIMIGNDTTRITNAALDSIPRPIHKMNSGAREIFGAVWIMMTNGMIRRSIKRIFAII